jgi:hypothetical protein
MTTAVYSPHPIFPQQDRQILEIPNIATIQEVIEQLKPQAPYAIYLNGTYIDNYNITLQEDDNLVIRAVMYGERGSQIASVAALIALAIAAPGLGAAAASGLGMGTTAGHVIAAGIVLGGSLIINTLTPKPTLDNSQPTTENVSPNYSLTQSGNRMRPYETMVHVIGQHKVYPDTDTFPYTIIGENGDLFLRQTFNFGISSMELSNIKIGETAIGEYSNIKYEISGSDGALKLFPANTVQEVVGVELKQVSGYTTRTTATNCVRLEVSLSASVFQINEKSGNTINNSVRVEGYYRPLNGSWLPLFNGSPYWETTRATRQPLNVMFGVNVASGQYEVRIRKSSFDYPIDEKYKYATIHWGSLITYQPDTVDYSGQTRMAIEAKATDQLHGALDQLSAVVSSRCPRWIGSVWITGTTSNPAWWYLYVLRGVFDSTGRIVFGLGLSDDRIDIDGIKAWGAYCSTNNLSVNYVFDQNTTIEDSLNLITRAGRASPDYQTGKWGVIYDQQNTVPVQVFNMSTILADTFDVSYVSAATSDEVIVNFIDSELWKPDQVRVSVPGIISPETSAEFSIAGITNRNQAGAEANLIAASQALHRRYFEWEADAEALVVGRGDVVALSHALFSIESGRLVGGNAVQLILDHDVDLNDFTSPYVQVRAPNGTIATRAVSGGTGNTINLTSALPFTPSGQFIDYIFSLGSSSTPYILAKIISIMPVGDFRFRLFAREESAAYYAAASGGFNYTPPGYYNFQSASVTDVSTSEDFMSDAGIRLNISWTNVQALGARVIVEY